jgi:ankyrin repeat protein
MPVCLCLCRRLCLCLCLCRRLCLCLCLCLCRRTLLTVVVLSDPSAARTTLLQRLLRCGADPNTSNNWGGTPLRDAATQADAAALAALIQAGAVVNCTDHAGLTPLMALALSRKPPAAVEAALAVLTAQPGLALRAVSRAGATALDCAVAAGHDHTAGLLREAVRALTRTHAWRRMRWREAPCAPGV